MNKLVTLSSFFALAVAPFTALAVEALGLDIGKDTLTEAHAKLSRANAAFEDDYGYKGYGNDLPVFKVGRFERFDRLGKVREAWLRFAPNKVLYSMSVTYGDAGEAFKAIKDGLDAKYGKPRMAADGFIQRFDYKSGPLSIRLARNTFGFGEDQTTELVYTFTPLVAEVEKMKLRVDADIKQRNAQRTAKDL